MRWHCLEILTTQWRKSDGSKLWFLSGWSTSITRFKYLSVSARILFRECRGKSGGVVGLRWAFSLCAIGKADWRNGRLFKTGYTRACLKVAFRQMCVTICGTPQAPLAGIWSEWGKRSGYVNRIRAKYATNWSTQMMEMNFQTHCNIIGKFRRRNIQPWKKGRDVAGNGLPILTLQRFRSP